MLRISVTSVKYFQAGAEEFYRTCKRETNLDLENTLLMAQHGEVVVGMVRLCLEFDCYVLRTMQIHPAYLRQGIGAQMLQKYEVLLNERQIGDVYCMPYAHLESFYRMIGFVQIAEADAPMFLQERVRITRKKKPNEPVILMMRSARRFNHATARN